MAQRRGESTLFTRSERDDDLGSNSDEANSAWNRSRIAWIVYDDDDFSGTRYCLKPNYRVPDFDDYEAPGPGGFSDNITSVRKRRGCGGVADIGSPAPG
jgi:hypothetical protein